MHGKIPDVQLVEHRVRNAPSPERGAILRPACRIGFPQIDHHGPLTVDPQGTGVGVAGLPCLTVHVYPISVEQTLEVSHPPPGPGAVTFWVELLPGQRLAALPLPVKQHCYLLGGGCPDPEGGLVFRPEGTQVVAWVGVGGFKFFGIVKTGHGRPPDRLGGL